VKLSWMIWFLNADTMMSEIRAAAREQGCRLDWVRCGGTGRRTELAPALECEDSGHETASGPRSSKLGGDDSTQWVVSAYAYAHDKPPDDESTNDTDGGTLPADCLTECADDDNHELNTVWKARVRTS
jgi:hypothetical protein